MGRVCDLEDPEEAAAEMQASPDANATTTACTTATAAQGEKTTCATAQEEETTGARDASPSEETTADTDEASAEMQTADANPSVCNTAIAQGVAAAFAAFASASAGEAKKPIAAASDEPNTDEPFDAKAWLRSDVPPYSPCDALRKDAYSSIQDLPSSQSSSATTDRTPGAHAVVSFNSSEGRRHPSNNERATSPTPPTDYSTSVTAHLVTDEEDAEKLRERLQEIENAPTAIVVDVVQDITANITPEEDIKEGISSRMKEAALVAFLLLAGMGILLGILAATGAFQNGEKQDNNVPLSPPPNQSPTTKLLLQQPTLQTVQDRGFLKCRVIPFEFDSGGISYELCKALAAAIFGNPNRTEFIAMPIAEMWPSIDNGTIDIATSWNTNHMGRDVYEAFSNKPKAFSTPYFITGTQVAGTSELVECVNNRDTIMGVCKHLKICAAKDTTTEAVIQTHMDGSALHLMETVPAMFEAFADGTCNVIAGEPQYMPEQRARDAGYTGEYTVGSSLLSTEPQAMTSRQNDPEWTDFTTSVVQALFTSELENITKENATLFPETNLFGEKYKYMYQHAIRAVGNWGDVFRQTFGQRIVRNAVNQINRLVGQGGLLYAPPLAALDYIPNQNQQSNEDVPPPGPIPNGTLEKAQKRGVLRCGIIPERPGFATIEKTSNNDTEAQKWTGMDIDLCHCLAAALLRDPALVEFVPVEDATAGFSALAEDLVDVAAGIPYSLQADVEEPSTHQGYTFSPIYFYGDDGGMLALVTNENATQWADFVRWTIYGLIHAEEQGIKKEDASEMPSVDLFGPSYTLMFRLIALNFGNYGDIYERNLEELIPRQGSNLLNDGATPLINPLPVDEFR